MTAAGEKLIAAAKESVRAIRNMKAEDSRPAKGGWAPGRYMCLCPSCGAHFIGDKRSFQCADCAYAAA